MLNERTISAGTREQDAQNNQSQRSVMKRENLLEEINKGTSKPHGAVWYNMGRFLYVFCALTLCLVALIKKVAF